MNKSIAGFTAAERVVLAVLLVYVTGALIVLTPIRAALGVAGPAALPPPPAVAIAQPTAERPAPAAELGALQAQRAREIVADDRSLATALGGTPHSIVKSGPWTTRGADGNPSRLLGAAFVVAPRKPIELRSTALPGALYDQSERTRTPYQRVVNEVSAKHVTQLLVLVDLERGRVVNITPGPGAQGVVSTPPPGFRRTVPLPVEAGG